jgi:Putative periplasmic protein kinase ArgK and related GTPases of G3E family
VLETVATTGDGVADLAGAVDDHRDHLRQTGRMRDRARSRAAAEIRTLLRQDTADLVEAELRRRGGVEAVAERVADRETDPYTVADDLLAPVQAALDRRQADDDA